MIRVAGSSESYPLLGQPRAHLALCSSAVWGLVPGVAPWAAFCVFGWEQFVRVGGGWTEIIYFHCDFQRQLGYGKRSYGSTVIYKSWCPTLNKREYSLVGVELRTEAMNWCRQEVKMK